MTTVGSEKRKSDANGEPQKKKTRKDSGEGRGFQKNQVGEKRFSGKNFPEKGPNKFAGKGFQQKTQEKQDWKVFKQQKKELRIKRKEKQKSKDLVDVVNDAKKIYETLKCKTTKGRADIATKLHNLLKGGDKYTKMVLSHDTARMVQCLLKVSPPTVRAEIFEKLSGCLPAMAMSKYAHFCVLAMLKHGSADTRERLIEGLFGNYVKLCSHSFGHTIVDSIYITWATAQQKSCMRQEFYSDLYRKDKDMKVKCLVDTFKDASHMKNIVMGTLKQHIVKAVNKKLVDNSLFHGVLIEYLTECSDEDKLEMATAFSGLLASLASTREGTRAATLCFWYGTAKERRSALKHLREHVEKVCVHEFGYYLILAILHTIDDTKMLKKTLLDTIVEKVEVLVQHEGGRKIVEWMIQPGDTTNFHPSVTSGLNEGLKYSKKDIAIRQAEILEAVHGDLVAAVAKNGNFWLSNGHIARTTATILLSRDHAGITEAYENLAKVICDPSWTLTPPPPPPEAEENPGDSDEEKPKKKFRKVKNPLEKPKPKEASLEKCQIGVEDAGLHIVLKKFTKTPAFAEILLNNITEDTVEKWLPINRGCFLLVDLLKSAPEADKLMGILQNCREIIENQKSPGASVLLEKI